MPEPRNSVDFVLPPDMKATNTLSLDGPLAELFRPFARQVVVLSDSYKHSLMVMVSADVTFLYNPKLFSFLFRFGTCDLSMEHAKGNLFLVDRAEPDLPGAHDFMQGQKAVGQPAEAKPEVSEGNPASSLNLGAKEKEPIPKDRGTAPSPKEKRTARAPKGKEFSAAFKRVFPGTIPVAKIETAKPASNLKATNTTKKEPFSKSRADRGLANQGRKNLVSPIRVNFFPEKDAEILAEISRAGSTPASDLYLRRQAIRLSLSPGFDTLLSLPVVRQIQPLDYQLRTVRHVLSNLRGRALLCDEVGMGKTIEAGLIALEYILRGLVRRVLILAPPSLVEQWREEMQSKFNLDFEVYDSPAFKAHPNPWQHFPRILASIDTAKRDNKREQVLGVTYDLVIVDEAHHLKNSRSQGYQLVSALKKKYILLLTATPVENDLEELFNLITLLLPGQLETAASFKRKYISRGDPLKPRNTTQLKQLVREVMVRNRRSETGAIAGRRSAQVVEIKLSDPEMALYRRLTTFVRGYYSGSGDKPKSGVSQFVLKILQREMGSSVEAVLATLAKMAADTDYPDTLRRIFTTLADQSRAVTERAKTEALLRLLPKIDGKVIIFTGFTETQRSLTTALRQAGLPVAELHSGLRRQEKEEQVSLFAGEVDILVSTETGSEGRNLQFCRHMVNYDLPWNPMRIEQRIGRIHRLGQEKDVQVYNFAAGGTIESYILELLDAKINMFQLVVGELDMILGNLKEKKDLEDLIMDIWAGSSDDASVQVGMEELGNRMVNAREHYLAVKALDDRLLDELTPEE
ncbi:MAG: DEAD/DEAH box helicase [Bacillota bacterium]